ncbi:MAG: hypothetical protein WDM78_22745 [Puia sp.]
MFYVNFNYEKWLADFAFNVFLIQGFSQSTVKQIDSLMNVYYRPDLPGAVIDVELKNKTVFKKSYGKASLVTDYPSQQTTISTSDHSPNSLRLLRYWTYFIRGNFRRMIP